MIDRTLCIYFMISRAPGRIGPCIGHRMPAAIPHAGRTELEGDVRRAGASLVGPLGRDGRGELVSRGGLSRQDR